MTRWIRFEHLGAVGFGTLEGEKITCHEGSLFHQPRATGKTLILNQVTLLTPTLPTQMIGLWNNFKALGVKLGLQTPPEPLYFLKSPSSFLAGEKPIPPPAAYEGKVIFEGELGVIIGKTCRNVSEAEAPDYIFGYTCVNDVTAVDILKRDSSFDQWSRAKSFDGFGVFGPVVATGLDPARLSVRSVLNGAERQNYPVSDMHFSPQQLVSRISHDLTLVPGDIIICGTSVGVGSMKPGSTIEISIEGIGTLRNTFG
ncbi:MAG: fumarylacetoacetate hydrolase family protein [Deltaproteobacteria bacterium]|nr:fumarylacetoacetate hydrolase family protein [Deltaproteobacteria bacterium]